MNQSKAGDLYRQGDIMLMRIADGSIPSDELKETKTITIAYGETTGHHHSILEKDVAKGFAKHETDLAEYIRVTAEEGAVLSHQEHDPITIPPGDYEAINQYEYTPEKVSRVID